MCPYSGIPEEKWDKMERCVERVMKQGYEKGTAIAICHKSIAGTNTDEVIHSHVINGMKDKELEWMLSECLIDEILDDVDKCEIVMCIRTGKDRKIYDILAKKMGI